MPRQEGDIQSITIVSAVPIGQIELHVAADPNSPWGTHPYGARKVALIDLVTNGAATNSLAELVLRTDYGDTTDGGALLAPSAGTVQITGNVVMPPGITSGINITGAISQPLTVGGQLLADLTCSSAGNISVLGAGPHTGNITIGPSYYWSTMDIRGSMLGTIRLPCLVQGGVISVEHDLGPLYSPGAEWGLLIDGSIENGARVTIGRDLLAPASSHALGGVFEIKRDQMSTLRILDGAMTGSVHIFRNLDGSVLDVHGRIWPGASITIDGSVYSGHIHAGQPMEGEVTVHGDAPQANFFAYNGMSGSLTVDGDFSAGYFGVFVPGVMAGRTLSGSMRFGSVGPNALIRIGDMTSAASITVDRSMAGDVELLATPGPGEPSRGELGGSLEIGAALPPGESAMSGTLTCDGGVTATGRVRVHGSVSSAASMTIGSDPDIGGLAGTVETGDCDAGVTVYGALTNSFAVRGSLLANADVVIYGDVAGSAVIDESLRGYLQTSSVSGTIEVGTGVLPEETSWLTGGIVCGDISGQLRALSLVTGRIQTADIKATGSLEASEVYGSIQITGSVAGNAAFGDLFGADVEVLGDLEDPPGDTAGCILINGSFDSEVDFTVYGKMFGLSSISVDLDGYDPGEGWGEGAIIRVDQTEYAGNDPAARVYEIQCPVCDANNDGTVNAFDIDPFVLGLQEAAYNAAYPGLVGSRVYHMDANCDGLVNAFDITSSAARVWAASIKVGSRFGDRRTRWKSRGFKSFETREVPGGA